MYTEWRMPGKKKNAAAVALGKKRWQGVKAEERSAALTAAVQARWKNTTEADRAAQGKKLAEASAAARKKKEK